MSQSTAPPATAATRRVLTRPEAVAALRDRTAPPPWCGAGAYAPPGWDFATMGRPPIIHMAYTGGNRGTILERVGRFPEYSRPAVTADFDAGKLLARQRARDAAASVEVGGRTSPGVGAGVGSGATGVRGLTVEAGGVATHGLCRNVWRCIRHDRTDRRDFLDGVRRGVWTVLE